MKRREMQAFEFQHEDLNAKQHLNASTYQHETEAMRKRARCEMHALQVQLETRQHDLEDLRTREKS